MDFLPRLVLSPMPNNTVVRNLADLRFDYIDNANVTEIVTALTPIDFIPKYASSELYRNSNLNKILNLESVDTRNYIEGIGNYMVISILVMFLLPIAVILGLCCSKICCSRCCPDSYLVVNKRKTPMRFKSNEQSFSSTVFMSCSLCIFIISSIVIVYIIEVNGISGIPIGLVKFIDSPAAFANLLSSVWSEIRELITFELIPLALTIIDQVNQTISVEADINLHYISSDYRCVQQTFSPKNLPNPAIIITTISKLDEFAGKFPDDDSLIQFNSAVKELSSVDTLANEVHDILNNFISFHDSITNHDDLNNIVTDLSHLKDLLQTTNKTMEDINRQWNDGIYPFVASSDELVNMVLDKLTNLDQLSGFSINAKEKRLQFQQTLHQFLNLTMFSKESISIIQNHIDLELFPTRSSILKVTQKISISAINLQMKLNSVLPQFNILKSKINTLINLIINSNPSFIKDILRSVNDTITNHWPSYSVTNIFNETSLLSRNNNSGTFTNQTTNCLSRFVTLTTQIHRDVWNISKSIPIDLDNLVFFEKDFNRVFDQIESLRNTAEIFNNYFTTEFPIQVNSMDQEMHLYNQSQNKSLENLIQLKESLDSFGNVSDYSDFCDTFEANPLNHIESLTSSNEIFIHTFSSNLNQTEELLNKSLKLLDLWETGFCYDNNIKHASSENTDGNDSLSMVNNDTKTLVSSLFPTPMFPYKSCLTESDCHHNNNGNNNNNSDDGNDDQKSDIQCFLKVAARYPGFCLFHYKSQSLEYTNKTTPAVNWFPDGSGEAGGEIDVNDYLVNCNKNQKCAAQGHEGSECSIDQYSTATEQLKQFQKMLLDVPKSKKIFASNTVNSNNILSPLYNKLSLLTDLFTNPAWDKIAEVASDNGDAKDKLGEGDVAFMNATTSQMNLQSRIEMLMDFRKSNELSSYHEAAYSYETIFQLYLENSNIIETTDSLLDFVSSHLVNETRYNRDVKHQLSPQILTDITRNSGLYGVLNHVSQVIDTTLMHLNSTTIVVHPSERILNPFAELLKVIDDATTIREVHGSIYFFAKFASKLSSRSSTNQDETLKLIEEGDSKSRIFVEESGAYHKGDATCLTKSCIRNTVNYYYSESNLNAVYSAMRNLDKTEKIPYLPSFISTLSLREFLQLLIFMLILPPVTAGITLWCFVSRKKNYFNTVTILSVVYLLPLLISIILMLPPIFVVTDICRSSEDLLNLQLSSNDQSLCLNHLNGKLLTHEANTSRICKLSGDFPIEFDIISSVSNLIGHCDTDPFPGLFHQIRLYLRESIVLNDEIYKPVGLQPNLLKIWESSVDNILLIAIDFIDKLESKITCEEMNTAFIELKDGFCCNIIGPLSWVGFCEVLLAITFLCLGFPSLYLGCCCTRNTSYKSWSKRKLLLLTQNSFEGNNVMFGINENAHERNEIHIDISERLSKHHTKENYSYNNPLFDIELTSIIDKSKADEELESTLTTSTISNTSPSPVVISNNFRDNDSNFIRRISSSISAIGSKSPSVTSVLTRRISNVNSNLSLGSFVTHHTPMDGSTNRGRKASTATSVDSSLLVDDHDRNLSKFTSSYNDSNLSSKKTARKFE